jgi:hypothetical protein
MLLYADEVVDYPTKLLNSLATLGLPKQTLETDLIRSMSVHCIIRNNKHQLMQLRLRGIVYCGP